MPSDGEFDIQICSYFYNCYWNLYNSDLTTEFYDGYVNGEEATPTTSKKSFVLSGGTYYLNISSKYYTGKYKFLTQFTSYGVNDQAAVSYISPLNYSLRNTITGAITETDDEDWYKIAISQAGYYLQKIVLYFYNFDWILYDSDLTEEIAEGCVNGAETTPATQKKTWFFLRERITSRYIVIMLASTHSGLVR